MIQQIQLYTEGMTYALCPVIIENSAKNVNGILDVKADYASEKCSISYNDEKINLNEIKKIIKKAGYESFTEEEFKERPVNSKTEKLKKNLIMAALIASPLFLLMFISGGAGCCVIVLGLQNSKISQFFELLGYRLGFLRAWQLQIVIATIIQFGFGRVFYKRAWAAIKSKMPGMDVLIVLGTTTTYLYSVYNCFFKSGSLYSNPETYFDSSVCVIVLVMFGKYLEEKTKFQTSNAVKILKDSIPDTARLEKGSETEKIKCSSIKKDDILIVKPGEKIPADGIIIYGSADVDEKVFTGESTPDFKKSGDTVLADSINLNGALKIKAYADYKDFKIHNIINLIENAQSDKAKVQKLVDKISSFFVPVIITVSVLTFIVWYFIMFKHVKYFLSLSVLYAVSVLVVACPCALGLATPTALAAGIGICSKEGILIKNSRVLDKGCVIDTIVLDKTGTITEGKMDVESIKFLNKIKSSEKEKILKLSASAEKNSEHPAGKAVYTYIKNNLKKEIKDPDKFYYKAGNGVKAQILKDKIIIGNKKFLEEERIENIPEEAEEGLIFVAVNGKCEMVIQLKDKIKESSKEAVKKLQKKNIEVIMLTGDSTENAEKIGKETGIEKVIGSVLPDDKNKFIKQLKAEGKKVAMAGDGVNDAAAISEADIGFAMGNGSDATSETADIVILNNNLLCVIKAINMCQKIRKITIENLFFAFIYNIIAVSIAASGNLSPIAACSAMSFSSISVLLNSLRLKRKNAFKI